ncbi:MAG: tetratricopeptide repeat protein [Nannocystales bacterium]
MNIWAWIYDKQEQLRLQGHHRLATVIDALPTAVCDMRHEQAEAMVPEGLALAADLEEPWVEIYLRHWLMQSRVLHRYQGRDNLEDCVALLEFSHRPGNRDCPQSLCVVQDFANCYGVTDGPGYAQERLSVTEEALGRIDPTWPCFECISLERASALQDAGRLQDAVDFIDAQLEAATAADVVRSHDKMFKNKAHCLVLLGRSEEALALLRAAPPSSASGQSGALGYKVALAEALAAVGQPKDAALTLPALEEIDDSDGRDWLAVVERLVAAQCLDNTTALGRQAAAVVHRFEANGALWSTAETALMAARLAAHRGLRHQGQTLVQLATQARNELKAPHHLDEALAQTRTLLEQTPLVSMDAGITGPDALNSETLPKADDAALELLGVGCSRWPDDARLAILRGSLLSQLGLTSGARRSLETFLQAHPDARDVAKVLGGVLRDTGQHEALETLVQERFEADDPLGRWLLATSHEKAGRLALAVEGFKEMLVYDPEADAARARLCEIAAKQRRWEDALALSGVLVECNDPGPHDWDRMVAATALERWGIVRASAARLGMDVAPGDAPIDEHWGGAWIRTGRGHTYWATRTGPVTARIETISGDREARERQDDVVLFDPAPVERDETDEHTLFTYRELDTLRQGERRAFTIDAVHPGPEALQKLVDTMGDFSLRLQQRSGEEYRLTAPGDEDVPGIYLFAAVPATADLEQLHGALTAAANAWPGPAVWVELCEALVAAHGPAYANELARQRAVAESYGM